MDREWKVLLRRVSISPEIALAPRKTHRFQEIKLTSRRPQVDRTGPYEVVERVECATCRESLGFAELDTQPLSHDPLWTSDFDNLDGILSNGKTLQEGQLDVRPLRRPVVARVHLE